MTPPNNPVQPEWNPGRLVVLSAPSGSGKSTLRERLLDYLPDLVYSVSYTTRPPRPGEKDGLDYNFIDHEAFRRMIDAGQFLEWAEVFGNYYGTGRAWVLSRLAGGRDVVADVDVVGAGNIKKAWPAAVLVFVVPPSLDELVRRLKGRRTERDRQIVQRLERVTDEIGQRHIYDYLLVNDDLERAVRELVNIVKGGKGRPMAEAEDFWPEFFAGHEEVGHMGLSRAGGGR